MKNFKKKKKHTHTPRMKIKEWTKRFILWTHKYLCSFLINALKNQALSIYNLKISIGMHNTFCYAHNGLFRSLDGVHLHVRANITEPYGGIVLSFVNSLIQFRWYFCCCCCCCWLFEVARCCCFLLISFIEIHYWIHCFSIQKQSNAWTLLVLFFDIFE